MLTLCKIRKWTGTVLLLAVASYPQSANPDAILGRWYTGKNEAMFEFFRKDNGYHARLIPLKHPDARDRLNPADSLKSRKLHGLVLVSGLVYNADKNRWENGSVYNPSDGKTYSCHCTLLGNGSKMRFRGYFGVSALGGSRIFTRAEAKK